MTSLHRQCCECCSNSSRSLGRMFRFRVHVFASTAEKVDFDCTIVFRTQYSCEQITTWLFAASWLLLMANDFYCSPLLLRLSLFRNEV